MTSLLDENDKDFINNHINKMENKTDFGSIKLPSSQDSFFKPKESGDYHLRIVSDYHRVNKWWAGKDGEWNGQEIKAGRPYLYDIDSKEGIPMDLVKIDILKDRDGNEYERLSVNNGFAWVLINRTDKENVCVQVWEVFQKGLQEDLQKFTRIKGALSEYDIVLTRDGAGLATKWSVIALDSKALSEEDKEMVEKSDIKLEDIYKLESFNDKAKIDRLSGKKKGDDIPF